MEHPAQFPFITSLGLTTQNSANNNQRVYYGIKCACILEVPAAKRSVRSSQQSAGPDCVCERMCRRISAPKQPQERQKAKHRSPQLSRRKTMKTLRLLPLRLFLASEVLF